MLRQLIAAAALLCAGLAPAAAEPTGLSPEEQRIVDRVRGNNDAAFDFLERVVNINSGTMNHAGVKQVGDAFRDEFDDLDFDTKWIDLRKKVDRAGHLVARRKGDTGNRILLIGHLDTVFPADSPFQTMTIDGDRAIGPGVADMKAGNVVVLFALKALHEEGLIDDAAIEVVFTGDEEKTGKPIAVTREALVKAAKRADVALNFEGGERGAAVTGRRGSSSWRLVTTGERAHSSGIFSDRVGAGATFEMARILNRFYEELAPEEYLTFNPGVVVAGTDVDYDPSANKGSSFGKTNVVAQKAVAHGGLRFITEEQKQAARARMREIAADNLPKTGAEIAFTDSYPAMFPSDANLALLAALSRASEDLGREALAPNDPSRRGAADISFAAPYAGASLDGLGVYGAGAHALGESMEIDSLLTATERAAVFIYRLTRAEAARF